MAVVPILSLLIAVPLVAAALLLLIPAGRGRRDRFVWRFALGASLVEFVGTLWMWWRFDPSRGDFQLVERVDWIPSFGIQYAVGVDGISLFLVVLTGFLTPLALLGSWASVHKKVKAFSFFLMVKMMRRIISDESIHENSYNGLHDGHRQKGISPAGNSHGQGQGSGGRQVPEVSHRHHVP